jgi:putative ABC transport system substrate-binding protein
MTLKRRQFIAGLGAMAAWPLAARAQQSGMRVVGVLSGVSEAAGAGSVADFLRGLGETGFVEGRNVVIEYRWADNQADRLPALAADLVGRKVAVIYVTASDLAIRTVMAATKSIPVVFRTASDPVDAGFVTSLNRPDGNVTGITHMARELIPKRLELLHEVVPTASKIAILLNPNNPRVAQDTIQGARAAASRLGLQIIPVYAGNEGEIESAIATAVQQGAGALFTGADASLSLRVEQFASIGLRHALPTLGNTREAVLAGQLMSYAANQSEMNRLAGTYAGRILKGEKPGDLPVQTPTKYELAINIKTAKVLGLTVPPTLLATADEVIE